MASRYLAQFEEVVSGWQTQLSMVRYDIESWFDLGFVPRYTGSLNVPLQPADILLPAFFPSDVFTILQEIQRTWSYLEPLFIGSEEVKKELPEDAKRFEGIDTDVKGLLKSVSHTLSLHMQSTHLALFLRRRTSFPRRSSKRWQDLCKMVYWPEYEELTAISSLFLSVQFP